MPVCYVKMVKLTVTRQPEEKKRIENHCLLCIGYQSCQFCIGVGVCVAGVCGGDGGVFE
eukprot:m.50867 g.50867  ORF g.50867 m.50867 type:complete len:59 (+) comp11193_c0_seq1:12649-12825(+)